MAGNNKGTGTEIIIGGFKIRPSEIIKEGVIRLKGEEAFRIWNIVRKYDIYNPLIREEIEKLLEEWIP